ncbi:MAG: ribonuclease H-like domain-containing protein, partial [Nanoarchaeota archaeon]
YIGYLYISLWDLMFMDNYFIVDVETCPINLEKYSSLSEEEKSKLINPIDSRIVAIGIKYKGNNLIFIDSDEKNVIECFWNEWKRIKQENQNNFAVGFNIINFDIPFIVTRSFINNVEIVPFMLKSVVDLKEKINAYRYGKSRGKLSEYGRFLGLEILDVDGSKVAGMWSENKIEEIKAHLIRDLEITEQILHRTKETKIIHISRW